MLSPRSLGYAVNTTTSARFSATLVLDCGECLLKLEKKSKRFQRGLNKGNTSLRIGFWFLLFRITKSNTSTKFSSNCCKPQNNRLP